MAVGKNKRMSKGKKGGKKKAYVFRRVSSRLGGLSRRARWSGTRRDDGCGVGLCDRCGRMTDARSCVRLDRCRRRRRVGVMCAYILFTAYSVGRRAVVVDDDDEVARTHDRSLSQVGFSGGVTDE